MVQLVSVLVVCSLLLLAYSAKKNAGIALAIAWSTYALEQLLQQAHPVFWRYSVAVNIGVALFVAIAVWNTFLRGRLHAVKPPSQLIALYLLLAFCAASYLWSAAPNATLTYLEKFAPYLFVFVILTPICVLDNYSVTSAAKVTAYFGGLIVFGLLFSEFGRRGVVLEAMDGKMVEGNPLAIADYGSTVAICAFFLLFAKKLPAKQRAMLLTVGVLATYLVMRSMSRGQLVTQFVAIVIWLPITCRVSIKKSFIVPAIAALVGCVLTVFAVQKFSLGVRWSSNFVSQAGEHRFEMISASLKSLADGGPLRWITGLGNSSSYELIGFYPHNVPIEVLVEEGLIGFMLFAFFACSAATTGWRVMHLPKLPQNARFNIGLLMALFTFHALLSLKQGSLIGSSFFLSTGACIAWVAPRYLQNVNGIWAAPSRSQSPVRSRAHA